MSADAIAAYEAIGVTPHPWQIEAFDAAMGSLRGEPVLLQACTGSGKTYLALALCYHIMSSLDAKSGDDAKYWRIILSVPSEELVRQTVANFEKTFGKRFRHGMPIVGAWYGKVKHDARIIVACHASLSKTLAPFFQVSRGKPYVDEAGVERFHPIGCAFWLFDECHLAGSDEVTKAVETIRPKTQIGITATLKPGGIPRFRRVVYDYQIEPAIRDGVLVEPEFVYASAEEQGLDPNITVLSMIRRAAPPGPGVVDAYTVDDAEWYANFLRHNDVKSEAFHSKLRDAERSAMMRDLLAGRIRCLVHVDMLTTGVDVPGLRWLAWRRERGSAMAIVQQGGRLLRQIRNPSDPTLAWAGPKTRAVFLFPRKPDWMRSLALTSPTGASLMGAAEDESRRGSTSSSKPSGGPSMTIIPPAEAAPIVGEWIAKLVDAVAGYGVAVEAPYKDVDDPDGAWRALPITTKQHVKIMEITKDGHKSPVKYLPKDHREAVKALLRFPEVLLQGHASDLLRLFFGLQRHAGKHYAANKHQLGPAKWWPGVPVIPFPPPIHAIDSLQGGADA